MSTRPPEQPVVIVDYDPRWPERFREERDRIVAACGKDAFVAIEHVGSTAVPGLAAKPIIDIMAGVRALADVARSLEALRSLGYVYVPEYEKVLPERRYFRKLEGGLRAFHLHVVETESDFWDRHIHFRNHLRANPDAARTYARLKRELAQRYGADRQGYTNAKGAYIMAVDSGRPAARASVIPVAPRRTLVELSHPIEAGMRAYPGLPAPQVRVLLAHGAPAAHAPYAEGTSFQIASYELGGNTGTYVDAPFHRHPGGADLADLPLARLADLVGTRITVPGEGPIEPDALRGGALSGRAVLVHTGWSARWGTDGYFRSGPFLTAAACRMLVDAGAALVGIDCANIDDMNDPARPAHTILLGAGIPVVEHLRGLEALPSEGFRFHAAPPAIRTGTSFPVRAYAVVG